MRGISNFMANTQSISNVKFKLGGKSDSPQSSVQKSLQGLIHNTHKKRTQYKNIFRIFKSIITFINENLTDLKLTMTEVEPQKILKGNEFNQDIKIFNFGK